jgi:DNA-binding response OmpR family regulator
MTPAEAIDRWPDLRGQAARVASVLASAEGRVVACEQMAEAIFDLTSEYPSQGALITAIRRARQAGVPIATFTGIGWRLIT